MKIKTSDIKNLLLIAGPSGGGKSTFIENLRDGSLPDDICSQYQEFKHAPVVDITNKIRRLNRKGDTEAALSSIQKTTKLIIHYDIISVFRSGGKNYQDDPSLGLLDLLPSFQTIFIRPDQQQLIHQFTERHNLRMKNKNSLKQFWRQSIAPHLRKTTHKIYGREIRFETDLYRDPIFLQNCYDEWKSYISTHEKLAEDQTHTIFIPCIDPNGQKTFRPANENI